ncbi:MAG: YjbQ family protein [Planctomycetes bacterium]|nr:YjbQ family protein [Planctomycetota bacterium]
MTIINETLAVSTRRRCEMVDITRKVADIVVASGISDGEVVVYCPHTTAAITINENADPDVIHDILMTLEELLPQARAGYRHNEGNSDAHVKSSLLGASETVLVQGGRPMLGTWQGIFFCEFAGPRSRKVAVQVRG